MASYGSTSYPPPPGQRPRATSASSGRYIPDTYRSSFEQVPPPAQAPGYPYPYGMPTAPPMAPMAVNPTHAYPPNNQYSPPANTLHPSMAATRPPYATAASEPYMQSSSHDRERRHSRSSQHSRRSHDSHRSHRSHHSYRTPSEERERERRHEHRHREHARERRHSDYDKPLKRVDTPGRSFGGTIFSLLGGLKDYLGPRDKY